MCPQTSTQSAITNATRQSEMAISSHSHMPVLGSVHPIKIEYFDIFRDVISLLAQVFIFLIDKATQEVPIKSGISLKRPDNVLLLFWCIASIGRYQCTT